jgi:8-oxo-dGTP pyrophosphatase MutT (NUDIX family)
VIEISDSLEPAHPAATVVLVRDGEQGLEALLLQRSKAVKHMGGMWVFPGGKVEAQDAKGADDEYTAALAAAIRETEEEAGLVLEADQLVYLSHWTTPEGARKRFSTWFFLGRVAPGQVVTVDGGEIANHRWLGAEQAFREILDEDNPFRLLPPTFVSMVELSAYEDSQQALRELSGREALVYAPKMVLIDDGICFLYDGDAGYASEQLDVHGARHRTYMINGQLEYIRQL